MRFLRAGREAVLVEFDDLRQVVDLHATLRRDPPAGVLELVPAARTLLLMYDASTSHARLVEDITTRTIVPAQAATPGSRIEIPVRYDGADLPEVAGRTGLAVRDVVRRHQQGDYVVAFSGFSPGFAYLVGGDPDLRVPRRDTSRTRVPAGSVALADEFTGVYPRDSPGGWQLIGRTDAVLWDLTREPPALLAPGTRVRFVARTP